MAFSAVSAQPEIAFNRCNAAAEHLAGSPSLQAYGGSSAWPSARWSEWEPTAEHLTPAHGQLEPEYLVSATHSVSHTPHARSRSSWPSPVAHWRQPCAPRAQAAAMPGSLTASRRAFPNN